jgi:hypothetical protein
MTTRQTLARLARLEHIPITADMTSDDIADRLAAKWNQEAISGVVAVIEIPEAED